MTINKVTKLVMLNAKEENGDDYSVDYKNDTKPSEDEEEKS